MLAVLVGPFVGLTSPAHAGVLVTASPTFPASAAVGATGQPATLRIQNTATPPDSTSPITIQPIMGGGPNAITLVPACGSAVPSGGGNCPSPDPGVLSLSPFATGQSPGACAGITFTLTVVDAGTGKVAFAPSSTVVLQPPGSAGDTCLIAFTFDVLGNPTMDSQTGIPGTQTSQIGYASARSSTTLNTGQGVNVSTMSVPGNGVTLTTTATAAASLGSAISDTATVIGSPGGALPTGSITFTAFGPNNPTCTPPVAFNSGLRALIPGAPGPPPTSTATSGNFTPITTGSYRWVAAYTGDANYASTTSLCGALNETSLVSAAVSGRFNPLTPARILDTRNGTGGISGPIGAAATVAVQVTGQGGVPGSGVSAVALNVTVTQPTSTGFLTLFPAGTARPLAANLNFTAGKTVPNLVVAKVGSGGTVSMFNSAGTTHVIVDVAGWYSDVPAGNAGRYTALTPARILDTRNGTGGGVRLGPGASLDLQVSGQGGVPATGAGAAVLNVTATGTTATSFLTVYPGGAARPLAANLNFDASQTVGNRAMVGLGTGGKVTIYNHAGSTDVIVDVGGWFSDASVSGTTGVTTALTPARILDTRNGTGGIGGPIGGGVTVDVQVTGQGGVPVTGASAVILNATVVSPAGGGWLTIFPTGAARPLASDLNYASGETRANLVVAKIGTGGKVGLFTSAGAHVIFDVAGWVS